MRASRYERYEAIRAIRTIRVIRRLYKATRSSGKVDGNGVSRNVSDANGTAISSYIFPRARNQIGNS